MQIDVHRGGSVESRHLVDVAVVSLDEPSAAAELVLASGDPDRLVMPRSAVKPMQAVPLLTSGAADALGLSDVELALACASHNGESAHIDAVMAWLDRLGFTKETLECGPQSPISRATADQLVIDGLEPGRQHNNCSGKHTGFLSVCVHQNLDPSGYLEPDHPVQRDWITPAVEQICQLSLSDQKPGVDGCGIPVWSVPLRSLANGWARLAMIPEGQRILAAMMAQPFYVAGTGRPCTEFMSEAKRPVAVKVGAEGVYCAVVPPGPQESSALGLALKVQDGAQRAAPVAMAALLERFGALAAKEWPLHNHGGRQVGQLSAAGI